MLTQKQKEWIDHLSDQSKIKIVPFDPSCEEKYQKVKAFIQGKLGEDVKVEHCGASSLGISGQDEIDLYIPVSSKDFDKRVASLAALYGKPKSLYPRERARFVTSEAGKHVDVFVINEESAGWLESLKFEAYLRSHPEKLEEYRILKESGDDQSTRDYYRRKIEFINTVLQLSVGV